jgi:hypothetical protein
MPKTRATIKRERKITAVYCRENRTMTIISVLRFFNDSELWNKTKEEWNLEQWKEYFQLKEQTKNL